MQVVCAGASRFGIREHPIKKYKVHSSCTTDRPFSFFLEPQPDLFLQGSQSGWNQLPWYESEGHWALKHMQGGVFSRWGHLYLVNGFSDFDRYKGGIWVFSVAGNVATLVDHSNQDNQSGTFTFEFHPDGEWCPAEEPEGIDIWDLESGMAPGIGGQIHVIMIDNCPWGDPAGDDLYFKHFSVADGDFCKI